MQGAKEVTVAEAAERLGVVRQRIDQLIRAGKIRVRRVGPIRVCDAGDVERLRAADRPPGRPRKEATAGE